MCSPFFNCSLVPPSMVYEWWRSWAQEDNWECVRTRKKGPPRLKLKKKRKSEITNRKNIFNILTKNDTPFSFLSILRNFMILVWLFEIERDIKLTLKLEIIKKRQIRRNKYKARRKWNSRNLHLLAQCLVIRLMHYTGQRPMKSKFLNFEPNFLFRPNSISIESPLLVVRPSSLLWLSGSSLRLQTQSNYAQATFLKQTHSQCCWRWSHGHAVYV